jgi:dihydropteroate synthase
MGFKDTFFSVNTSFNCHGRLVQLNSPLIMGIINLTPDSFYSGSRISDPEEALEKAGALVKEGVSIVDLGACSTRPGSIPPSESEERERLLPALEKIRIKFPELLISIDTWRSAIAREAIQDGGADIINDISAGQLDNEMISTAGHCKVPYVLMHMKGSPDNMQLSPEYSDILDELFKFFGTKIEECRKANIHDLIIDPGFGFGKTIEQNYALLQNIPQFLRFGFPVMAGISRKSMIYKVLGSDADKALNGTTVLNTVALLKGASILRVHDVKEALEAVRLVEYLKKVELKSENE